MTHKPTLTTKPLSPELWPAFEALFGGKGACGGCWCMSWRVEKGERWEALKGEKAKARMRALVRDGKAEGLLAFVGEEPVGWCAIGPRTSYAKLDRAPSLACDDAADVWSLPCFFIRRDHRGEGVATRLLKDALVYVRKRGGRIVEGYPARPYGDGKLPAAFAWTGVPSLFEKAGFQVLTRGSKLRVRKALAAKR